MTTSIRAVRRLFLTAAFVVGACSTVLGWDDLVPKNGHVSRVDGGDDDDTGSSGRDSGVDVDGGPVGPLAACIAPAAASSTPSCSGLAKNCGPTGDADCCASALVPGGTFNRNNDARYPATVCPFRLDVYEVTVGRFRKFVASYSRNALVAGAGRNPNNPSDPGWDTAWNSNLVASGGDLSAALHCDADYATWTDAPGANENRPINCITWWEAEAFCTWDNGRLPTEAEWTFAAAGGSEQRTYPWGEAKPGPNASLAVYGCYYNGSGTCTGVTNIAPVGNTPAGNGRWGHADMGGNVWEWVQDGFRDPYAPGECNNCAELTEVSLRALRGGRFNYLAGSGRDQGVIDYRYKGNGGVRCAHL